MDGVSNTTLRGTVATPYTCDKFVYIILFVGLKWCPTLHNQLMQRYKAINESMQKSLVNQGFLYTSITTYKQLWDDFYL